MSAESESISLWLSAKNTSRFRYAVLQKKNSIFIALALQPNAGQGRLILEVSRSHNDTPQSIELLWTRDRPAAETST
jgi:hypothetical protein